jgi:hypothetical protein
MMTYYFEIYRSPTQDANSSPLLDGIEAGCPFCLAKRSTRPKPGQKVLILTSGDTGQFGRCVEDKFNAQRSDQFYVKMDYDKSGGSRVVTSWTDLFLVEPFPNTPDWMPPLSVDDALALHESFLRGLDRTLALKRKQHISTVCLSLVATTWGRRLPLSPEIIWPMLKAHNFSGDRNNFSALYDFGLDLLIRTNGRKPIKRKLMEPLSRGKYMTPAQRTHWIQFFGHD